MHSETCFQEEGEIMERQNMKKTGKINEQYLFVVKMAQNIMDEEHPSDGDIVNLHHTCDIILQSSIINPVKSIPNIVSFVKEYQTLHGQPVLQERLRIKFQLAMLTKMKLIEEFEMYDRIKGRFRRIMGDIKPVKMIRSIILSNDDLLFFSDSQILQLYWTYISWSSSKPKPTNGSFGLYFAMKQILFENSEQGLGVLQQLRERHSLFLDDVLLIIEACNKQGSFETIILALDDAKVLTKTLYQSIIHLIVNKNSMIQKLRTIIHILNSVSLTLKLLETIVNFCTPILSISSDCFIQGEIQSLLNNAFKHPIDITARAILLQYNLLLLMHINDPYRGIDSIVPLVKELKVELSTTYALTLFVHTLVDHRYSSNLVENHLGSLLTYAMQFGNGYMILYSNIIKNASNWPDLFYQMNELLYTHQQSKFPEKPLEDVAHGFKFPSTDVEFCLSSNEVDDLCVQYNQLLAFEKQLLVQKDVPRNLKLCLETLRSSSSSSSLVMFDKTNFNHLKLLAIIRQQVKYDFQLFPYNTQMLNVLAFLNHPSCRRIAQIKTGEGKSTIIAILAAYWALLGHSVDIITTSGDLAIRDSKKYTKFYDHLGLKVGHNVRDHQQACDYDDLQTIIYGRASDFEFAYLKEEIDLEPVRDKRAYDVVIVDEVDSMFLDMQLCHSRRCSELAVNSQVFVDMYWYYIKTRSSLEQFVSHFSGRKSINYSPDELELYYRNVLKAVNLQKDKQYIVQVDENQKSIYPYKAGKIVVVDYLHTGQLKSGSRWANGLHTMIEAKENVIIQKDYMLAGAIGHTDFFNKYNMLFGLSGTVGTSMERQELESLYDVNCYDSPAYQVSQKVSVEDLVCIDLGYKTSIQNAVCKEIQKGRPVVIICSTINQSNEIATYLAPPNVPPSSLQLYNAVQKEENVDIIIALAGTPGMVTVATNTAGRGADITPTPQAERNGGLHVILTYKTINKRVETQAFGRTGRQGRKGTYHYILPRSEFSKQQNLTQSGTDQVLMWQKERDCVSKEEIESRARARLLSASLYQIQNVYFSLPLEIKQNNDIKLLWGHFITAAHELSSSDKQFLSKLKNMFHNFWNPKIKELLFVPHNDLLSYMRWFESNSNDGALKRRMPFGLFSDDLEK
jgi:hypothetical protein